MDTIISHLDTIIVTIIAIVLGWDRWKSGNGALQKQNTEYLKERNSQLEEKLELKEAEFKDTITALQLEHTKNIKEIQDQLQKTNIEVARFQATVAEKDKRIEELRLDLLGRNPEMVNLLKEINVSNKDIKKFMAMMHDDSKKTAIYQSKILEAQVKREKDIDTASSTASGDVMRTPKQH